MVYNIQQPSIPNAEDKWTAAEHSGNLLLFFPVEVRRNIKTSNGDSDAVRCSRVVNLDTGRILNDPLIFGTALVPNVGGGAPDGIVLGRLGQGQPKNGNNPPWILLPHDEADLHRAQDWLARDAAGQLTQPTAPPTQNGYGAPATGGWGQQAAPAPSPAPATGGWGNQAPAPAQGGWGNPPAQAPAQGGWGAPSAAPAPAPATPAPAAAGNGWGAPAPAAPQIDPGLVAALQQRGVDTSQLVSQEQAEGIAAAMGLTRG